MSSSTGRSKGFFFQAEKTFHWHLGAHFLTWTHDSTSCILSTDLLSSNFNFHISLLTLGILEKKSNTFSVTEKRIYNHGSKGITTKITHTWILSNDMITGNNYYVVLPLNPTQTQPFPMEYNNEKWKMHKAIHTYIHIHMYVCMNSLVHFIHTYICICMYVWIALCIFHFSLLYSRLFFVS